MSDLKHVYCAIIPARNEADRIGATLAAIRSRSEIDAILVVDDASTDATSAAARAADATDVIKLRKRLGKGGALQAGIDAAPESADVLVFLDADLGDSATEFVKLIQSIENDEADMTIGTLPPDKSLSSTGQTGAGMGLVVRTARDGIKRRTGVTLSQPLSGQRAIRREVLGGIGGKLAHGYGIEVALTLAVLKKGYRVQEVETMFRHRVTGQDFHATVHRARQFMDVMAVLRSS